MNLTEIQKPLHPYSGVRKTTQYDLAEEHMLGSVFQVSPSENERLEAVEPLDSGMRVPFLLATGGL